MKKCSQGHQNLWSDAVEICASHFISSKTESCYVALDGLELSVSCLSLLSVEIISMHCQNQFECFYLNNDDDDGEDVDLNSTYFTKTLGGLNK